MNNILLLFTMIFAHIIDDYCLQGILASMKQKAWWKNQEQYNDKYKYDYIIALAMHSFSWAFMIMCPILFTMPQQVRASFVVAFIVNVEGSLKAIAPTVMLSVIITQIIRLKATRLFLIFLFISMFSF